jgi:membrane associated rhomboid family serine protease
VGWYDGYALSEDTDERGGPGGLDASRAGALRRSPATVGLIAVCGVVFVATVGHCIAGAEDPWGALIASTIGMNECRASLELGGGLSLPRVWVEGEWWRVVTAGFEHGSWAHFILNIWSLWVVGPWAERCWGAWRVVVLFCVASVVGCLASMAWAEAPLVVGASAGIFGVAGALWVVRTVGAEALRLRVHEISARALALMLGAMVGLGFVVPIVAQAGHLGGLAAGAWIGWLWSGRTSGAMRGVGWGAVAAAVLGLGLLARAPTWRPGYYEYLGFWQLEEGYSEEGLRSLERALVSKPDDAALQNAVAYELAEAGVHLDRAESLVEAALEQEPENPDYLDTQGWILCRRGRVEEGLPIIERASALSDHEIAEIEGHLGACGDAALEP